MVVINVKSSYKEDEIKCFHFWGEKHPMTLICLFVSFLMILAIGITEYFKKK